MDFSDVKLMRFNDLKNLVYEVSEKGYILDVGDDKISYQTFFSPPILNTLLNQTASIILLHIDGKTKLGDILDNTYSIFEGTVGKNTYICDFMDTINKLERGGIIYSKTERERCNNVKIHSKLVLYKRLISLRTKILYEHE